MEQHPGLLSPISENECRENPPQLISEQAPIDEVLRITLTPAPADIDIESQRSIKSTRVGFYGTEVDGVGKDDGDENNDDDDDDDDDNDNSGHVFFSEANRWASDGVDIISDADLDSSYRTTTSHISRVNTKVMERMFASRLRRFLIGMFIWISTFVPIGLYVFTRMAGIDAFESAYGSLSDQVRLEFERNMGKLFVGFDSLSTAATSQALDQNETWPFVTLFDFYYLGSSTLALTQTPTLSVNHLVQEWEREEWDNYTSSNAGWLVEALERSSTSSSSDQRSRRRATQDFFRYPRHRSRRIQEDNDAQTQLFIPHIYKIDPENGTSFVYERFNGPYLPSWQSVPIDSSIVNFNAFSDEGGREAHENVFQTHKALLSHVERLDEYDKVVAEWRSNRYSAWIKDLTGNRNATYGGEAISTFLYPIFDTFETDTRQVVALITAPVFWSRIFTGILPPGQANVIVCVVETLCGDGDVFTYRLDGTRADFLGRDDYHNRKFDKYAKDFNVSSIRDSELFTFGQTAASWDGEYCPYILHIYPSEKLHEKHVGAAPIIIALLSLFAFICIGGLSASYDCIVRRRIRSIARTEKQAHRLVAAHFPNLVRDRLFKSKRASSRRVGLAHPKTRIRTFLDNTPDPFSASSDDLSFLHEAPIADLFLHCTVLFADIEGFSAWSSEREPSQVFTLLESLFQAFDKLAKKRGVFKVETIGDSYVAVTGLPDPQPDHAIRMTRFARDCLSQAYDVTKFLETLLGPGTSDLRFRFGMHSGQVTAGVLRGEKTRFQLFGDTVNTASRMESTGQGNRIQLSETTAQLLFDAGKDDWLQGRHESVNVKGKGLVKTFWAVHRVSDDIISRRSSLSASKTSDDTSGDAEDAKETEFTNVNDVWREGEGKIFVLPATSKISRNVRLVGWLTEMLGLKLKKVVAQRRTRALTKQFARLSQNNSNNTVDPETALRRGETLLDELVEAFVMPKFDPRKLKQAVDPESVELDPNVVSQLTQFVEAVSMQYCDNPFHNFEHASHVTMSAVKLLNRIVVPEDIDYEYGNMNSVLLELHDFTYGINSDALAQFAVAFSALIHDVDHRGVPNAQLADENPELGERYKFTSVAEQNSVDVAWELLVSPQFIDLRNCIFSNDCELRRFRQYLVNLVLATDIFEKRMKFLRQERWNKAFAADSRTESSDSFSLNSQIVKLQENESTNLKATIVLEHIIQAADVSHTMQHWKIYKKWNEMLFEEMYSAYESGRADKDPSLGWYEGELWFFDNYVIPLARKLEECSVFGVSSDECLNYAVQNRKEWECKGKDIVESMVTRYRKRKDLEVGGFTPEEINNFTSRELDCLLGQLIKKGRAFGTFKGTDKHGQRMAAQAWLDALEIHERCPASASLRDQTLLFPVFSGIFVFLKGGKILQDKNHSFGRNMAAKFLRDTKNLGDPVHYGRALARLCEVQAENYQYEEALKTLDEIKTIYQPEAHSLAVCNAYGTDRTGQAFSQAALWYHAMGETQKSLDACDYVLQNVLPHMDPSNILNSCEVLIPIVRVKNHHGETQAMRDLFDDMVVQNYIRFDIKFTPCHPLLKPLIMLLDLRLGVHFPNFSQDVDWLLQPDGAEMNDFMDHIVVRLGWAPNTIAAELCLRVAKKLQKESIQGLDGKNNDSHYVNHLQRENIELLVKKGINAARRAAWKMSDDDGNVILPVPYEIHQPVVEQLHAFAEEMGIACDADASSTPPPRDRYVLKTSFGVVQVSG